MQATAHISKPRANASVIVGKILSSLVVAFMTLDGMMKLVKPAPVVEATTKLGFPEASITVMGVLLLLATGLYAFRRTSVLGAVLMTGYLGGAVATNLRADISLFNDVFPVIFGGLAWLGIWIRDPQLRSLMPLRSQD